MRVVTLRTSRRAAFEDRLLMSTADIAHELGQPTWWVRHYLVKPGLLTPVKTTASYRGKPEMRFDARAFAQLMIDQIADTLRREREHAP